MRAIVSTGPIYSIVEACSRGSLDRCGCKATHGRIHYKPQRHISKHNRSFRSSSQEDGKQNKERVFQLLKSHQREQVSWSWRGCDSNIGFAYRISKSFMDEPERRFGRDFKSDVHLHNYEAGRLVSSKILSCLIYFEICIFNCFTFTLLHIHIHLYHLFIFV